MQEQERRARELGAIPSWIEAADEDETPRAMEVRMTHVDHERGIATSVARVLTVDTLLDTVSDFDILAYTVDYCRDELDRAVVR